MRVSLVELAIAGQNEWTYMQQGSVVWQDDQGSPL